MSNTELVIEDKLALKDLHIAVLSYQNARLQADALMRQAEQAIKAASDKVKQASEKAGLDPAKQYNIDFETGLAAVNQ